MNKPLFLIIFTLFFTQFGFTQSSNHFANKGRLYIYWGWNQSFYSKSDIHFKGQNYDFTLQAVVADDKPSPFRANIYLNPGNATIPQYNFRLGYFINEKYSISIGADHMKYVVRPNQTVKINGIISQSETTYNGQYNGADINIQKGFLELEHTDGLNYVNAELRRQDKLADWKFLTVNAVSGLGAGMLVPRTDATLLHFDRHDKFHVAGYGLGGLIGLQFKISNHFFIQSEYKLGYINMPDIRTTSDVVDFAEQSFFFHQYNILFGSYFGFNKKHKE